MFKSFLKCVIYESFENSRGISQTERHHQIRKMTDGDSEPFPIIPFMNADQTISIPQIKHGENSGLTEELERGSL